MYLGSDLFGRLFQSDIWHHGCLSRRRKNALLCQPDADRRVCQPGRLLAVLRHFSYGSARSIARQVAHEVLALVSDDGQHDPASHESDSSSPSVAHAK